MEEKTITLTLTEKEVALIRHALTTDIIEARRTIERCKKYPEDARWAKYGAEAQAKIPLLESLDTKLFGLAFEAKLRR